ncbi:DHH family phosphoesterase [Candidatus Mycoplasma mahonii]|uniref:DHH family phosphoesterase n=1 Tax=Candidatus Mycoplasma mahonii TaxID=3004105 RepID=UPI0026EC1010|nr:bifunctional oligoribonuclease/PAP phosphatase NrnA [Candidatus Mycoplasma mahonii]WKX02468.1 bifunctional oligoribonuclease/PAP phosphatase NrnA [Candidatus Mycoplasma mahonii]
MNYKKEIFNKIKENNKIALFQHIQPDGDSISSSIGLGMAIKEAYPKKEVVVVADYEYLKENFKFLEFDKKMFKTEVDDSYLGIVGDVSVSARILNIDQLLKTKEIICFDHHQNVTDLKSTIFWHEPTCPASAMQAYQIAKEFEIKFSEGTSLFLMIGILTDTGFFKYSAANPMPLQFTSELLENISNKKMNDLNRLMANRTKADLDMHGYILNNIKYKENVAYIIFSKKTVVKYGLFNLKIKINTIGNIEGSNIWAFFLPEEEDGKMFYGCHMRSSGPKISPVATKWGGGGHFKACGAKVKNLDEVHSVIDDLINVKEMVDEPNYE